MAILREVGLFTAVSSLKSCTIFKHGSSLNLLLSRWSMESHTFVTGWGEFTLTLEDICELYALPFFGQQFFSDDCEDSLEQEMVGELRSALGECSRYVAINITGHSKHSFAKWQRYWFRDFEQL